MRAAAAILIVASWIILLIMMWRAYHKVPSAEQLADARHIRPPLPIDLYRNVATAAVEAFFLVAVLWPYWARRYTLRLLAAVVVLVAWFFISVPMDLNTMEWLHRRWLAAMVLLLVATAAIYPFLRRGQHGAVES